LSTWRSGEFQRERLSGLFRAFAPARAVERLESIDLDQLWESGKRLLLLDIDNTLVEWRQEQFAPEVLAWLERAKQIGFKICILSNTRRVERLSRISQKLGIDTVRGRFKPSRAMYRLALIRYAVRAEHAVMIGDQMMTDVLGANRAGIDAIWVQRMAPREFGPTAINRFVERLLSSAIYKALILTEAETALKLDPSQGKKATTVEQVFRFLIVGVASFVIDTGLKFLFMRGIHVGGQEMGVVFGRWLQENLPSLFGRFSRPDNAAAGVLGGCASQIAMLNSYIWNRSWTFEAHGKDRRSAQIVRFFAVTESGALLNAVLFGAFYGVLPGSKNLRTIAANFVAAAVVAVWNFVGQRHFAFRERKT
jgi:hypothetical protein